MLGRIVFIICALIIAFIGTHFVELAYPNPQPPAVLIPTSQRLKDSTVQIITSQGKGSGVYLGQRVILSAAHVCKLIGEDSYVKSTNKGKTTKIKGYQLDSRAPTVDLCAIVLVNEPEDLVPLTLAKIESPLLEPIFLSSYSGGTGYSILSGITVAEETIQIEGVVFLASISTIPAQPGASGGPVVNRDGEIVGIVVCAFMMQGLSGYENLSDIRGFVNGQLGLGL